MKGLNHIFVTSVTFLITCLCLGTNIDMIFFIFLLKTDHVRTDRTSGTLWRQSASPKGRSVLLCHPAPPVLPVCCAVQPLGSAAEWCHEKHKVTSRSLRNQVCAPSVLGAALSQQGIVGKGAERRCWSITGKGGCNVRLPGNRMGGGGGEGTSSLWCFYCLNF